MPRFHTTVVENRYITPAYLHFLPPSVFDPGLATRRRGLRLRGFMKLSCFSRTARTLASKAQRKADKKVSKNLELSRASRAEEQHAFCEGKLLPFQFEETCHIAQQLVASFHECSGTPLFAGLRLSTDIPRSLWEAPIACMVVRASSKETIETVTEPAGSSECVYANLLACEAFGAANFTELIGSTSMLPSSLSSSTMFESRYTKKLRHGSHQLTLRAATRWQLGGSTDEAKSRTAYAFTHWELADGTLCGPAGLKLRPPLTADAKAILEAAASAAAAELRRLKQEEGRGNTDALVLAGVTEMRRLRDELHEDIQLRSARESVS